MRVFFISLLSALSLVANAQIEGLETKVYDLIEANKTDKAIKLLEQQRNSTPKEAEVYFLLGQCYYFQGDGQNAFENFTQAISLKNDYSAAFYERGNLYIDIQMFEEAKLDYEECIAIAENDSMALLGKRGLANYYLHNRDFTTSVSLLEEVLEVEPEDLAALNNIAIALEDLGRMDEAIDYLKKVVIIQEDFAPAYINLGFQLSHVGRYEEALDYFNTAEKISKNDPYLLSNRAFVYYKMEDYSKALKDVNASLEKFSSNAYAYKNRALIYLAMGDDLKACEDLYKAKAYNFTQVYGNEVLDLIRDHCVN